MTETTEKEFIPGISEEVNVTEKAVKEMKKIMEENKIPSEYGLRVGIKGGVKIFIDMKSSLYLSGTEIDYTDGLTGKGFVFNNPNAVKTCGCGSSFGVWDNLLVRN